MASAAGGGGGGKVSGAGGPSSSSISSLPPTAAPQLKPLPSCTSIFDRFWYCASPGSQFSYYYRNGEVEYCPAYLNDWMTCLKSQLVLDEARKRSIMADTSVVQPNPHPNTVLPLKAKPAWTNE